MQSQLIITCNFDDIGEVGLMTWDIFNELSSQYQVEHNSCFIHAFWDIMWYDDIFCVHWTLSSSDARMLTILYYIILCVSILNEFHRPTFWYAWSKLGKLVNNFCWFYIFQVVLNHKMISIWWDMVWPCYRHPILC